MDCLSLARAVLQTEKEALEFVCQQLDNQALELAVRYLQHCVGRVVVCGMGKSGLIAKKIAATLSSTGTPSLFLHPAEALHGDLGIVGRSDVFVSISTSGETDEILQLIPHIQRLDIPHISLVGNPVSTLGLHADVVLNVGIPREVSPIQAVPMASSVAALAMGDVLATLLMHAKQFQPEDFAQFHPGGSLGRKLLTSVREVMKKENLPIVEEQTPIQQVMLRMSEGMLGMVAVLREPDAVAGVITDGDLRRALTRLADERFFSLRACDLMTKNPKFIAPNASLSEAESLMQAHRIQALLVVEKDRLVGIIAKHFIR